MRRSVTRRHDRLSGMLRDAEKEMEFLARGGRMTMPTMRMGA